MTTEIHRQQEQMTEEVGGLDAFGLLLKYTKKDYTHAIIIDAGIFGAEHVASTTAMISKGFSTAFGFSEATNKLPFNIKYRFGGKRGANLLFFARVQKSEESCVCSGITLRLRKHAAELKLKEDQDYEFIVTRLSRCSTKNQLV